MANDAEPWGRPERPPPMTPYASGPGWELYLADAFDVLPGLEPDSAGLCLTDPPYDASTHAGARTLATGEPGALVGFAPFAESDVRRALHLAGRVSRRWTIATLDWRHTAALEVLPPAGLRFIRAGVWAKANGAPQFTGDRPAPGWESLAFLHRGGRMRWGGGGRSSVWSGPVEHGEHPTTKPQWLLRDLCLLFSDPGDVVVDPFTGSGSTGVAALAAGRRFAGIEQVELYAELAARRLEAAAAQGSLWPPADLAAPKQLTLTGVTP